jgi:tRNA (guanine10-N2)-methyltransferase
VCEAAVAALVMQQQRIKFPCSTSRSCISFFLSLTWFSLETCGLATLAVFRSPSRNTYGFAIDGSYALPEEELQASYTAAAMQNDTAAQIHYIKTQGSKEFTFVHGTAERALITAASRCVLLHGLYDVLGAGSSCEEAAENAATIVAESTPSAACAVSVAALGGALLSRADIAAALQPFQSLLTRLGQEPLWLLLDRNTQHTQVYLCRQLAAGLAAGSGPAISSTARRPQSGVLKTFALRTRPYTTATALEPELAFVMANLAGVVPGARVCDPFCGSCSLLLAAARLGAGSTVGFDADAEQLNESAISDNFAAAQLPLPQLRLADISSAVPAALGPYDTIITDPPYHAKARVSSSDSAAADSTQVVAVQLVDSVIDALLELAATALVPGGRLVYLLPVRSDSSSKGRRLPPARPAFDSIPASLRLVSASEQRFTPTFSRWLVVIEKRVTDWCCILQLSCA